MAIGDKIYIADKPTLDLTKINTDDIKTVVAAILNYVDTLEASLGQVGDAANVNGSVNAKIRELRALVDTVETTLATIVAQTDTLEGSLGQVGDGAWSEGSVHSKLRDLRTLVDSLEGSLGQTTDAANAAGTVNAKLKELRTQVLNTQAFKGTPKATATTGSQNLSNTILSVTGKGLLVTVTAGFELQIIIDGVAVSASAGGITAASSSGIINLPLMYRFENSLVIKSDRYGSAHYILD